MRADLPPDERRRLETLRSYAILDTPPQPEFDGIAALAARIFDVPVSLVTLVDEKRQWFKARRGLEVHETDRDLSFCAHAILEPSCLVVPDATKDGRFSDNDLVTGPPHIRFYAGAPIRVSEGATLGTVAVIDYVPREASENEMQALEELACQASSQLELHRRLVRAVDERDFERAFSGGIVESIPGLFFVLDSGGRLLHWNGALEEATGRGPGELGGVHLEELVPEEERARIHEAQTNVFEKGGAQYEAQLTRREGAARAYLFTSRRLEYGSGPCALAVAVDTTEIRRMEREREELQAQLSLSQKLESVGQLAGGIAHDFNNMLCAILGHAEMALEEVGESDPGFEHLQEIVAAAERSANLTRQLLTFARKREIESCVVDLNDAVENGLNMFGRLIGENIELDWRPGEGLWRIMADPVQIDQILANLCVNARDAIGESGTVDIRTANARVAASGSGGAPRDYVTLSVRDTGCGIEPEALSRIFEPFYTTKGVGEGTGLGLASVYGAVKQAGGFIEVESEPGEGSEFTVYFPRYRGSETPEASRQEQGGVARGSEGILLVEDETVLRDLVQRMLAGLGYAVYPAGCSRDAIRIMEDRPESVQLLLSDVVMPRMSGFSLYKKLRERHPELRAVFMTGYDAPEGGSFNLAEFGKRMLSKPFSRQKLSRVVREALDGENPG